MIDKVAMNKKETEAMETLKRELLIAKSFRYTDKVEPDVIPEGWNTLETGWVFNVYTSRVSEACSTKNNHSTHGTDRTSSQGGIKMYSTKLLALKALRNAMEVKFASELANIDRQIELE